MASGSNKIVYADSAPSTPPFRHKGKVLNKKHLQDSSGNSIDSSYCSTDSGYNSVTSTGSSTCSSITDSMSEHSRNESGKISLTGSSEITKRFLKLNISDSINKGDSGIGLSLNSTNSLSLSNSGHTKQVYSQPSESHTSDNDYEYDKSPSINEKINVENKSICPRTVSSFVQDDEGDSYGHILLYHKQEKQFESVIYNAPHPNYLDTQNYLGQTYIYLAGILSLFATVRKLVLAGADFLMQDYKGNTVLHRCVINGDIDCVRALLRKISWKEYEEQTKLMSYKLRTLPLVPSGVDMFNDDGLAPIHLAVQHGFHEIIQELWEAGADINIKSKKSGDRAVHMAIRNGDIGTLQLLINDCHVDMNLGNYNNVSPITLANSYRRNDIVEYLVEAGADTTDLFTPIEYQGEREETDMDLDMEV